MGLLSVHKDTGINMTLDGEINSDFRWHLVWLKNTDNLGFMISLRFSELIQYYVNIKSCRVEMIPATVRISHWLSFDFTLISLWQCILDLHIIRLLSHTGTNCCTIVYIFLKNAVLIQHLESSLRPHALFKFDSLSVELTLPAFLLCSESLRKQSNKPKYS